MLTLPIKKKWFDMIKSGEKKEEYREIKPYYTRRFENSVLCLSNLSQEDMEYLCIKNDYNKTDIILRNGYSNNSPSIKCKVSISIGCGKPEWGAEPNKEYYVLKILSVEELC